jgi:hypothetical protein
MRCTPRASDDHGRERVLRTDQPVASVVEDVLTMLDRRLAEPPPPRPLDATRRSL